MSLVKIADYYPDYKSRVFDGEDVIGYSVYNEKEEKLGDVHEILLDEQGRFRYFVIDTGFWIFGKKVLMPVGRTRMDFARRRVYAMGMTHEQAEALPEYRENTVVDYDYEEQVRETYRPSVAQTDRPTASTGEGVGTSRREPTRDNYSYDDDPDLYGLNEQNHEKLKLYEERLVADKDRYKAGEVSVGKRVETETAEVSVPVEKERVVIERKSPTDATPTTPGTADFREGEVARMEVYEESADVEKQAFVREEVKVRKEVDRETVATEETVRREELDVDVVEGKPNVKDL
ncbi:MAG: DUF2382 domain-containing protein [Cyanophyceae cyanobacterium]